MTRKHLISVLKLVLVAALMTYVCFTIQWGDTLTTLDEANKPIAVENGRIVGPWDVETVTFRDEAGAERQVRTGPVGNGTKLEATAGFLTCLRNLDFQLFILGALCYVISLCFSSVRWWWLLRVNGVHLTPLQALRYTWIGVFFNNVVPGQTGGDVVKALYIMRRAGEAGRVASIVSVLVDRLLGLASLALLGAVVVLFYIEDFPKVAIGIWAVLLAVGLGGVVAFSRRIRKLVRLDTLLRKLPLSGLLQKVDQAIFFYRGHKGGMGGWLLAGVANHCVSVLSVMLVGDALGVGMPVVEYFVLIPIINIVSAVPLGPNGWGVGEWLYGSLFGAYGARHLTGVYDAARVMATRAVALSVLYRIHLSMWSLVGGVLMLFEKDRVTRADVEEEIAREEQEAEEAMSS